MLSRQRPLPRTGDHVKDAASRELQQRARNDRAYHDAARALARDAAGRTDVTIPPGQSLKLYHGLGHVPSGWRIVDQLGPGLVYRVAWDATTITVQREPDLLKVAALIEVAGAHVVRVETKTKASGTVTRADFIPDLGQAANANSHSLVLRKHNGSGGGTSNLSSTYDGTTTATTADQRNAMTLVSSPTFSAGDVLEFNVTVNGTGGSMELTTFEVAVEYSGTIRVEVF